MLSFNELDQRGVFQRDSLLRDPDIKFLWLYRKSDFEVGKVCKCLGPKFKGPKVYVNSLIRK